MCVRYRDSTKKFRNDGINTEGSACSISSYSPFFKDTLDNLRAHRTPADLNENLLSAGHMIDLAGKVRDIIAIFDNLRNIMLMERYEFILKSSWRTHSSINHWQLRVLSIINHSEFCKSFKTQSYLNHLELRVL